MYIHNISEVEKTCRGRTIPAGQFWEIPQVEVGAFAADSQIIIMIANGEIAISKNGIEDIDGINNQINFLNGNLPADVRTRFERDDIILKLACMHGQADANGDLQSQILVPGTAGLDSRLVGGGYAVTDSYSWNDRLTAVDVVDVDNLLGYGANTVLRTYHDDQVDSANAGWYFWKSHGTEGEVEIEPMGYFGNVMSGLYLRCTFKVAANAKVKSLIWWGMFSE